MQKHTKIYITFKPLSNGNFNFFFKEKVVATDRQKLVCKTHM